MRQDEPKELEAIAMRFPEISNGDLAEIVRLASPAVHRMLVSRRWHEYGLDLEDIVAESVEKLWQYRKGFDASRGTITFYLYAIARNVAAKRYQELQKTSVALADLRRSVREQEDRGGNDSALFHDLMEAIGKWPSVDRELLLAWADGEETNWATRFARDHKMDANTVRVRRLRLARKLRDEMNKLGHVIKEQMP